MNLKLKKKKLKVGGGTQIGRISHVVRFRGEGWGPQKWACESVGLESNPIPCAPQQALPLPSLLFFSLFITFDSFYFHLIPIIFYITYIYIFRPLNYIRVESTRTYNWSKLFEILSSFINYIGSGLVWLAIAASSYEL